MVVYGFHPFELYAADVGKNLERLKLENVHVLEFTPRSIGDDYREQDPVERHRRNLKGVAELRGYIQKMYGEQQFAIELHCVFSLDEREDGVHPQYHLFYPAWNFRLEKVVRGFAENYKKTKKPKGVWSLGMSPRSLVGFYSLAVEYYTKIRSINGESYNLTKKEGTEFTVDLIGWIRNAYS